MSRPLIVRLLVVRRPLAVAARLAWAAATPGAICFLVFWGGVTRRVSAW